MKLRGNHCRRQYDIEGIDVVRMIDWFIKFADPQYREIPLVERLMALRKSIMAAINEEEVERARREDRELEKVLRERESSGGFGGSTRDEGAFVDGGHDTGVDGLR